MKHFCPIHKKCLWPRRLSLLLVLTLLFTACAPAGGEEPSPDVPPEQEEEILPEQVPDPDKEILIYANISPPGVPGSFDREAIDKFNRSHADVQIVVKDYWNADAADASEAVQGRDRLLTELAAGHVPDIIDLGVFELPYRQLAQKGYLEDLWPYIENDPDLGRENVLEAPLKAAEIGGGLYAAFGHVTINTLVGAVSQVGDRTSWTLEDLQDAFSAMPEDSSIVESYANRESIADTVLPMLLDDCVDWESGTCSFDTPGFRDALEFIGTFPTREEIEKRVDMSSFEATHAVFLETEERVMTGRQMLERNVGSLYNVLRLDLRHGGQCAFVGYPTRDGSIDSSFSIYGQKLAMSSTCQNKEAAWEFIRTILLPSYNPLEYQSYFPINRKDHNMAKNSILREEQVISVSILDTGSSTVPPMTEERYQQFEAYFNSIEKINLGSDTLYDLVMEVCGPYFSGDKTLGETVRLLGNRVGLYVSEQR